MKYFLESVHILNNPKKLLVYLYYTNKLLRTIINLLYQYIFNKHEKEALYRLFFVFVYI